MSVEYSEGSCRSGIYVRKAATTRRHFRFGTNEGSSRFLLLDDGANPEPVLGTITTSPTKERMFVS